MAPHFVSVHNIENELSIEILYRELTMYGYHYAMKEHCTHIIWWLNNRQVVLTLRTHTDIHNSNEITLVASEIQYSVMLDVKHNGHLFVICKY